MLDSLSSLFLERARLLLIILVAVQFTLICVWSWRRTTTTKRLVWIGFAAIPVLLSISKLTVTPRERVISLCHDLARFVDEGDVRAIGMRLSDAFRLDNLDRSQFEERLYAALERYRIDHPELGGFNVSFPGPGEAVAEFNVTCRVRSDEDFRPRVRSRWRVLLRTETGVWRVTGIETVPTPFSPVPNLRRWIN